MFCLHYHSTIVTPYLISLLPFLPPNSFFRQQSEWPFKHARPSFPCLKLLNDLPSHFQPSPNLLLWLWVLADLVSGLLCGLPCSSVGKESACNAGDLGSIPRSGRCPGEGNGNPLQCSCQGNPMGRGAWRAAVHGVARVGYDWATKQPPALLSGLILKHSLMHSAAPSCLYSVSSTPQVCSRLWHFQMLFVCLDCASLWFLHSWLFLVITPRGHHGAPSWAPGPHNRFPLALSFTSGSIYMSVLFSQFVPPSPSPAVHQFSLECHFTEKLPLITSAEWSSRHCVTPVHFGSPPSTYPMWQCLTCYCFSFPHWSESSLKAVYPRHFPRA